MESRSYNSDVFHIDLLGSFMVQAILSADFQMDDLLDKVHNLDSTERKLSVLLPRIPPVYVLPETLTPMIATPALFAEGAALELM